MFLKYKIFHTISRCVFSDFFGVDPWKIVFISIVLCRNMCYPNRRAFSTTSLSASDSGSGAKISAVVLSTVVTIQGV